MYPIAAEIKGNKSFFHVVCAFVLEPYAQLSGWAEEMPQIVFAPANSSGGELYCHVSSH